MCSCLDANGLVNHFAAKLFSLSSVTHILYLSSSLNIRRTSERSQVPSQEETQIPLGLCQEGCPVLKLCQIKRAELPAVVIPCE